ncbi:hypothetical protein L2E82_01321 [Cichorium intybus]|uniref:Uncharacterized protein n=1 Tax=Cichorium intybus TaxID=13427 RepID=A0ACB9GZP2_CICIN|nr:hypothetical protein L2E82_01321 [Cichorium intybus]
MEAVMGSSSPSSYLNLVSCRDKSVGFLCLRDDLLGKTVLRIPFHHSRNLVKNKEGDSKLSISVSSTRRAVRPVSLSSSHTQAEVENHELLIEQSMNGHTKARTVCVRFQLQKECSFGQNFLIVGDDPMFGLWDPMNAVPLTWSDGHLWTVDLEIPIGKCIKFKFIMQESNGKFMWQPGPDRILECFETANIITVCEDWEDPDSRRIFEADPTLNQIVESAATADMETVAANERIPVELMDDISSTSIPKTNESKGYAINMNEVLVSDQGVPVLVPGLSHLPIMDPGQEGSVHESPKDEVNGAVMASTGADMTKDLKLPELDSKLDANTVNLNPRPAISSIHEKQDSCKNQCQETQQDHQDTQSMKGLLLNDIQWGNNIMQKLLNIFGI